MASRTLGWKQGSLFWLPGTGEVTRMSKIEIRCKVLSGLFENEFYVLVNGTAAYYIHRDNVILEGADPTGEASVEGRVMGYLVDSKDGKTLVQLPGEAVVGSIRTWVENADVSLAA